MSKYQKLKEHLPSLYRPEDRETNLLNLLLKELGGNMDEISRELTVVMQSHWFKTADKATYDNHFLRARELAGLGVVQLHDANDREAIAEYPYLLDLARVGALLSIPPRREPIALRETVEEYRVRLLRIVNIYRNGLGTLEAIRNMVTAELPENHDLDLAAQQRSFSVEENIPYTGPIKVIESIGLPLETVGPLMRWELSNSSVAAVAPVVYIEGIEDTNDDDATIGPMVERFNPSGTVDPEDSLAGLGLAYTGTVAPGVTLRMAPTYSAFLVGEAGIQESGASDTQIGIADWQTVFDIPTGDITASIQTADKNLWFAFNDGGDSQLWRYNGFEWLRVLSGETLAPINCLHQRQQNLLVGSDDGLLLMPLYPNHGDPFVINVVSSFAGNAVYSVVRSKRDDTSVYVGSANGLDLVDSADVISENIIAASAIRAIAESDTVLYFGGDIGVMQYRFRSQKLYYLTAEFESELEDDWISVDPEVVPDAEEFGLPEVLSLAIGEDDTLWIGTTLGLARYRARKETESIFRNLLEGFSDLVDGPVTHIRKDEFGYLWFTTNRGLLRSDGRDLARFDFVDNRWAQLGQADKRYGDEAVVNGVPAVRGLWRYNRTAVRWENFDYSALQWVGFASTAILELESVTNIIFVDSVNAELGILSGTEFTPTEVVPSHHLIMRCKPDHTRIVNGGIPSVPRMPQGDSMWRYLALEPEGLVDSTDLPWWSIEGRLVPPPEHDAPYPGRFSEEERIPYLLGQMIYAYNPAAKVKFQWVNHKPLRVMVRLLQRDNNDVIDPAIIDRIWQGISKVKPAGVQIQLAVDEETVRGEQL